MFDSISPMLVSPESILTAPRSFGEQEHRALREESRQRAVEYLRATAPEDYGVHPLGFLNIPLFENASIRIRIHVWHKAMFSARSPYKVHDHSYGSYSIILAGHLRHFTYGSDGGGAEYQVALATPGVTNTTLKITEDRLRLAPSDEMDLLPGAAYGLGRDVFHYAQPMSDFVSTLYYHLRHPDSPGVSRVAIPAQTGSDGPLGTFPYELLTPDDALTLERAVIGELSAASV